MDKSIFTPEQDALQQMLRQLRLGAGLRQEDLAKLLEEPQSFVSKYEKGERRLDLIELRHICNAVGVSLLELVTRFEEHLRMQPNKSFVGLPKSFWANVRTISQKVGYTERPKQTAGVSGQAGPIKVPTLEEIQTAVLRVLSLNSTHLIGMNGELTDLGRQVLDYYQYRADILNRLVEPLLMNADQAKALFEVTQSKMKKSMVIPMNKRSGEMKKPAYFTGIINMLIEANVEGLPCNYNPQELTTVTRNREPFRTMARRIDGAFPGPVDPLAVWEIKESVHDNIRQPCRGRCLRDIARWYGIRRTRRCTSQSCKTR